VGGLVLPLYFREIMIIVVSGKKRSGKDSFYQITKEFVPGKQVVRYAFADPVKDYARKYFGVDGSGDKETYRFILQGIGQMMREEVKKSYWVDIISEQIEKDFDFLGEENVLAVITDARYKNEIEWGKYAADFILRIVRPALVLPDSHQSEVDLDDYKFLPEQVLTNSGDFEAYKKEVQQWLSQHVLT
jgi:hypothetical protein